jgi:hypothetical protein
LADPFGKNEPNGHSESHEPMMSPGFWLHDAALAWRQEPDQRLRSPSQPLAQE